MLKLKILACKIFLRELYEVAAHSPHLCDITLLRQGLHNEPEKLRRELQRAIDAVEAEDQPYDAICLAYGLCSNGVAGVRARKTPLVVPRAHDCIALLLGSRSEYQRLFGQLNGGIYWYSPGWIEQTLQPGKERFDIQYADYLARFGEDNAQYLMELEQGWMREYHHAVFVDWPQFDNRAHMAYTQQCADYLGWQCHRAPGSDALLSRLVDGQWDEADFLTVPPGQAIVPSDREDIVCAQTDAPREFVRGMTLNH